MPNIRPVDSIQTDVPHEMISMEQMFKEIYERLPNTMLNTQRISRLCLHYDQRSYLDAIKKQASTYNNIPQYIVKALPMLLSAAALVPIASPKLIPNLCKRFLPENIAEAVFKSGPFAGCRRGNNFTVQKLKDVYDRYITRGDNMLRAGDSIFDCHMGGKRTIYSGDSKMTETTFEHDNKSVQEAEHTLQETVRRCERMDEQDKQAKAQLCH